MPINFTDAIINIGQNQGFNWGAAFSAAFGAFFGALAAFLLNIIHENKKKRNIEIADFIFLVHLTYNTRDDLISFKEKTLSPILNVAQEEIDKNQIKYLKSTIISEFSYNEDLKKYYFLVQKNPKLYHLFSRMSKYIDFVNEDIAIFNSLSRLMNKNIYQIKQEHILTSIDILKKLDEDSDNLIYLLDILFKTLENCPKKYLSNEIKKINLAPFDEELENRILKQVRENSNLLKGWEDTPNCWILEHKFI